MAAEKDIQQATIHLDPPELGAMELKLEVNEERQTQVQVQVQNPQVKEALESSATRLREMLEKEGLQLANLDVSDQSQQQQQGDSDSSSQGGDGFMTNGDEDEVEVTPTIRVSDSLLDTYV
jgi:flagellar hook-length control protein FliK